MKEVISMKKVLSVFLVIVMCFALAGCGEKNIQLTTSNYKDYLVLDLNYGLGGSSYDIPSVGTVYNALSPNFKIYAASSNFIYNNVSVEIRVYGTFEAYSLIGSYDKDFDETITIDCNVGGSGSYTSLLGLDGSTNMRSLNLAYEVVYVYGSVTPA